MHDESAAMDHPETSLLAAFANCALTAQERASLLVHLGECARCRDVVFLGRNSPAAEPENAIAAGFWQKRWLFRLATAGLAACLVAAGAIAGMHYHDHRLRRADTAALRPVPQPSSVVASSPAAGRPPQSTHRKPLPPAPAKIVPRVPSIPWVGSNYNPGISISETSAQEMETLPQPSGARISPERVEAQRKMRLREKAAEQALAKEIETAVSSPQASGTPVFVPELTEVPAESSADQPGQRKGLNASTNDASQGTPPAISMRPQALATKQELPLPSGLAASSASRSKDEFWFWILPARSLPPTIAGSTGAG